MTNISFKSVTTFLADAFFPKYCLLCNQLGEFVCPTCRSTLPFEPHRVGENIIAATSYKHRPIQQLIQQWKYQNLQDLTPVLGELLLRAAQHFSSLFADPPLLVPVPLHRRRERARGFHHTLQLAQYLSSHLHWSISSTLLIKRFSTPPQMSSNGAHRRQNLIGSFELTAQPPPRPLLLIDDVVTTGSTLQECMQVLSTKTTSPIRALTIASSS